MRGAARRRPLLRRVASRCVALPCLVVVRTEKNIVTPFSSLFGLHPAQVAAGVVDKSVTSAKILLEYQDENAVQKSASFLQRVRDADF